MVKADNSACRELNKNKIQVYVISMVTKQA